MQMHPAWHSKSGVTQLGRAEAPGRAFVFRPGPECSRQSTPSSNACDAALKRSNSYLAGIVQEA